MEKALALVSGALLVCGVFVLAGSFAQGFDGEKEVERKTQSTVGVKPLRIGHRKRIWLNEMKPHELEAAVGKTPLAVIPMGSIEYHGPQNAFGVDINSIEAPVEFGVREGGGVLIPSLYWGGRAGHRLYPGSILVRTEVLKELLVDIVEACRRMGFKAVIGITGHLARGQVEAMKAIEEKYRQDPHIIVEFVSFPKLVTKYGTAEGLKLDHGLADHGGVNETSHMWASAAERTDLARLPEADADIPFWGLEGMDPHLASLDYGARIQEATRKAVAIHCKEVLKRARLVKARERRPAALTVRFSKSERTRDKWPRVQQGFILLIENGIKKREPYQPGTNEYVIAGLYEGLWGVHCWGLYRENGVVHGYSAAYEEVELKPGDNVLEF